MRVHLIDKNNLEIQQTLALIKSANLIEHFDLQLTFSSTIDYVLEHLYSLDMVFIEIELDQENGIDLACKIRNIRNDILIILLAKSKKHVIDGYRSQANAYVVKTMENQKNLVSTLTKLLNLYNNTNTGIIEKSLSRNKIFFKNIAYIEVFHHKTTIHFYNKDSLSCYYSLNKWKQILRDEPFGQPHKSFFVNFKFVKDIKFNEILLMTNDIVPLTRHYKESFLTLKGLKEETF